MKRIILALLVCVAPPAGAQSLHGLRTAAVRQPVIVQKDSLASPSPDGVSRRKLAIGAGVGAVVGGIAGGVWVNNSGLSKNEAWPMFVGGGALLGALIGAGLGMAVTAFVLP